MDIKNGGVIKLPEIRKVLFEKYSSMTAEELFLFYINGCEIIVILVERRGKCIGFKKENKFIFALYDYSVTDENNYFQIGENVWYEFERELTNDYVILSKFFITQLKKHGLFEKEVGVFHNNDWSDFGYEH